MASKVAEWFGSAVIAKLTNIISDAVQEKYHQLENTRRLIEKLNLNLPLVRKLVHLSADRLIVDPALSDWLKQIKDVIYEADDLLDELEYENLRIKVSTSAFSPLDSIRSFLASDASITRLKNLVEKLEEITSSAVCFIELLKLDYYQNKDVTDEIIESTSLMNDDEIDKFLGRNVEKDTILDILLNTNSKKKQKRESSSSNSSSSSSSRKELLVLPIVGIGGIGKTTLAKVIYNDPSVQDHFQLKAWVYVSDSYDTKKIMFDIIDLFASAAGVNTSDSLEKMTRRLIQITSFESFFLVLDDVSEQFVKHWEIIGNTLRQGKNGSAVLVTTQSSIVAEELSSNSVHINLNVLNETDYWRLFKYHAFGHKNKSLHNMRPIYLVEDKRKILKNIGREISRKLNGLPLAARVLGQLLNTNLNEEFWLKISRSEWWQCNDAVDRILPSIGLSYQYLNRTQKQCFAYCSIFPKNYLHEKHHIVQMWIAQGYFQPLDNERIEDIGTSCFEDLTRRSFFLHTWNNKYIMHDLMLDLAKYISRDECFVMEEESAISPHKVRHLTIKADGCPKIAKIVFGYYTLRTLLVFGDWSNFPCEETLEMIFRELRSLRVLDLSYAFPRGLKLPSVIGNLLHLRYLDIRGNGKILLGHSTCKLFHLQVLNLDGCHTESLPSEINNLISLRYLYADINIIENVPNIGNLTNLQELVIFNARTKKEGCSMIELKELNQLHGKLLIDGLDFVKSKEEALGANIREKKNLRHLDLKKSDSDPKRDEEIFEALQPHPNLTNLKIYNYCGFILPSWMLDIQNLSNLRIIYLFNCIMIQILPPFGKLPYLRSLWLDNLMSVTHIGDEFYGNLNEVFPCLEELNIKYLEKLTHWKECSASNRKAYFPVLRDLKIYSCNRIKKLHDLTFFSSLKILHVQACMNLENSPFKGIHESLNSLSSLHIHNILEAVTSLCLSKLTALHDLSLRSCPSVISLDGLQYLVNLKTITILRCPVLSSSPPLNDINARPDLPLVTYLTTDNSVFVEDGSVLIASLPSLRNLNIQNLDNDFFNEEQEKWLEKLTSLRVLQFEDCPNLLQLPISLVNLPLVKLTINDCLSIKSLLDNGLPVSLQVLEIEDCPSLSRLPVNLANLSLVKLTILFCRLIEALPESGLPASLQDLHIYGCPKLQSRCEKGTGLYWPMIAHIPFIEFRSSRRCM